MARIFGGATGRVFMLLCVMYFIMYIDRVNISLAAPTIQHEMQITNTQLGLALSAFGVCYALLQIVNGYLGDRFGPRKVLSALGIFWSLGTLATALVSGFYSLVLARILVGLGEAGTIPTATRAMADWVPRGRRGFAQGVTHMAARLAAAVAPPLVAAMMYFTGWRATFALLGCVSLVWAVVWYSYFRDDPREHRGVTALALAELPLFEIARERPDVPWRHLVPRVMPVMMVFFCHAWTLWLYLSWLPSFFVGEYHVDIKDSAMFTSGVFAAGMIGDGAGGLLTDWIYRRTGNVNAARRNTVVLGFLGSFTFMSLVFFTRDPVEIALCLAASLFFLEMIEGPVWAIPMDIAPRYAGVAGGFISTAAGLAAILSPAAFGIVADLTGGLLPPFLMSLGFLVLGVVLAFFMRADLAVAERPAVGKIREVVG
ncbi:MAG TPA: MFS transporter [Stellaceae bacterium]|nr:MFS transporter [Stellaceae bacterium]